MKYRSCNKLVALNVLGLTLVLGCDQKLSETNPSKEMPKMVTANDVKKDAAAAVSTAAAFSKQENDRILAEMKAKMEIMDANISDLRLKGKGLAADAKTNWDAKMVTLDEKRRLANAQLEEIGKSSSRAWVDVEKGAKSAWQELSQAFQDALTEF
jgi:hypothetical protein